ncbi:hypothetical protein CERSUDRAFT_114518 [Gelatoporia subvermispora B]|uniref:Uncharacterized protein n=1 Tax=Ceriporiopsis subvermispora (strain B) TaxID=914234 RepID=M2RGF3_CERS8|nr:hypothetical protein CERSUDRAFT_114518 [Gelatoporia subvermispora B]
MILPDDGDDWIKDPSDPSATTTVRPPTPTYSLPDYEASQAQQNRSVGYKVPPLPSWPKKKKRRKWGRIVMIALLIYFLLTVAIGVPILVVKLRNHGSGSYATANQPWQRWAPPAIIPVSPGLNSMAISTPAKPSDAVACNTWIDSDEQQLGRYRADLQYNLTVHKDLSIHSNTSYSATGAAMPNVGGSFFLDVNPDPTVSDAQVAVSMYYSDIDVRSSTSVCHMNDSSSNGLYIFVPQNLSVLDSLSFNVTLLLPQNASSLYVDQLSTILPHFDQQIASIASQVSFGTLLLGGANSTITADSLRAESLTVQSAFGEIKGTFNVTTSLVLDTINAPITADIYLDNDGSCTDPVQLQLSTGNSPLIANITLSLKTSPSSTYKSGQPDFVTHAQTFSAPLAISVQHAPLSQNTVHHMWAETSLAPAVVNVDHRYAGTFEVLTKFAEASVLPGGANATAEIAEAAVVSKVIATNLDLLPANVSFQETTTWELVGCVGVPLIPTAMAAVGKYQTAPQGIVEVRTFLSPATLLIGS